MGTSSAESNSENYTSTSSSQQQVDTIFHPEELKAVTIFNQMALTKRNPHEVEEMRERKKQKNRESAQRARDRFKSKMRWLEDQVRLIQERHDNLVRENTYMRHMHSAQSQKLDQLLKLDQEATVQEAAEQQVSVKRPHSSSDHQNSPNSALDSSRNHPKPRRRKSQRSPTLAFQIPLLSMAFCHISCQNSTSNQCCHKPVPSRPSAYPRVVQCTWRAVSVSRMMMRKRSMSVHPSALTQTTVLVHPNTTVPLIRVVTMDISLSNPN